MNLIRIFRKMTTKISPMLASKIMYRVKMNKRLNLKSPSTFNEKINYLKLKKYPFIKTIINCTDKYMVREYVKNKGLENNLTKLYGCWNTSKEINFTELPNSFVLECNHGCGYNILCKNKNNFDVENEIKKINKWMNEDFGLVSGEPHYSRIEKKIICEEYLEDDILDYKFFCFKGNPEFFYVAQNVDGDFHNMQSDFFYCDGSLADFYRTDHKRFEKLPILPSNLKEMVKIAKILSKDFEFVRVDLFNVNGKIYFSELTFSPCSGFMPINPEYIDFQYGKLIDLNKYIGDKYE